MNHLIRHPMLAESEVSAFSEFVQSLLASGLVQNLIVWATLVLVVLLIFIWAAFFRKPGRRRHHHHRRPDPAAAASSRPAPPREKTESHRRRRRRRREARRNPTLAETNGLPPPRSSRAGAPQSEPWKRAEP